MDIPTWIAAINGIGTLLVAGAVAVLGYRQFDSDRKFKAFQQKALEHDLRIKLLSERAALIEQFRGIYGEYFREAKIDSESMSKMIYLSQKGQLLFKEDLSRQIGSLTDNLLKHVYLSTRVSKLLEYDPRNEYQKKVDEQFSVENKIWDSLKPILDNMVSESRVTLD